MSYSHLTCSESAVCSYHTNSIRFSVDNSYPKTEGDIQGDKILDSLPLLENYSQIHDDSDYLDLNDDFSGQYSENESVDFHSETSLDTSPSRQSMQQHANQVSSLYYGLQPTHDLFRPQNKPIYSVTYSDRAHKFILLDQAGILSWCPENNHLDRQYLYPPYKHKLFLEIHFSSKNNVYFVLTKQRAIITFNSLFEKLHMTTCLENSLLNIYFLDTRSLLIGGGVNGVSIWKYTKHDVKKNQGSRIRSQRPMENYFLYSIGITSMPDNKLIRKIKICLERRWIFALSFYDVFVLTFDGILCLSFLNLHKQTINDCIFNTQHSLLLTVSNDSTLTLWSECGYPLHTFNSASQSNNAVLPHPLSPHLVLVATDKGIIQCYNLLTLEEEFSHHLMHSFIETIDSIYITKQYMLYAISARNISVFDFNYFCEFWCHLSNSLLYICFDRCKHKSDRFHALCVDGSIRVYSISENRLVSLVLPPPNINFPSSLDSVTYDRSSNLLYILIGPQEIWVYTTRTQPSCLLETYQQDIILSILNPEDPDSGDFVHTGITAHSFIPFCTCIAIVNSDVLLSSLSLRNETHSNLLVLGVKDGRLVFISTNQEFDKLFEMQVSTGEVTHVRVYENSSHLITQSISVNGFVLKLWSLLTLEQIHCFEFQDTLIAYWKINDTLMVGFSDGSLSLYSIKGVGSSLGGASIETSLETDGKNSLDKIMNIHGLERLNLFCTAHKSGLVKIWDHHKNLVKLIFLNPSLGGVYFLNTSGDLLVSLNQHLYIIRHEHVISSVSIIQGTENKIDPVNVLEESAVFENPNSQNGELVSTKHGLYYIDTLQSYLKPYDIDLHGPKGLSILDEMLHQDLKQSVSSSSSHISEDCLAHISSEILLTPTQSPLLLSYENFPNPVFSTPTTSRTSTPPPTEFGGKEALRNEIALVENQIMKAAVKCTAPSPSDEHIKQLPTVDKTMYDKDRNVVSKIDSIIPTSNTNLSRTNHRININQLHSQDIIETQDTANFLDNDPKNVMETGPKLSIAISTTIPVSTQKSKILRRRRNITRHETIIQHIYVPPSVPDEETMGSGHSISQNTPTSTRSPEDFAISLSRVKRIPSTKKRELISRMRTKKARVKTEDFPSPLPPQSMQATSQIEVLIDKEKLYELSPILDKANKIQIKQSSKKLFPLNNLTNHDFTVGWHEREYLKRLAYRFKRAEKSLHVWAYQAKIETDTSLLRAKLYPKFSKEGTEYLDLDEMLEFVEQNEVDFNRSRNSTITLNQSTVLSTSSFYAHKLQNSSLFNFRISNTPQYSMGMKATVSVHRKSRCVSAPFLRRDLTRFF